LKDREIFSIAGLWDSWVNKDTDEEVYSYTIITTEANPLMAMIHNKKKRMPAILEKKDEKKWINETLTREETMGLLKPFNESKMNAYTISKMITTRDIDVNVPQVLEPFQYNTLEPLPTQKSLF
jgi:putative SOS response-associated peptidase YedK